ncbi:MAG TPA: DUF2158 domain-containing protein [Pirellulales bacterium]|jgi:uncharacterized protein YodC (DUF2158 family)|nr:DUF2158 domain-containing protein [Pirellulales bacterium]
MAEKKFKVGDKVRLIVGGPVMAVKNTDQIDNIYCQWFAGKKLEGGYFAPETLEKVTDEGEQKKN